jgi:hypothetical protein
LYKRVPCLYLALCKCGIGTVRVGEMRTHPADSEMCVRTARGNRGGKLSRRDALAVHARIHFDMQRDVRVCRAGEFGKLFYAAD